VDAGQDITGLRVYYVKVARGCPKIPRGTTSFTDQAGRESTYTYDLVGNRLNTTYPTSVTMKRAYDGSERVSTIVRPNN
jgi:YD repeat-containing protein